MTTYVRCEGPSDLTLDHNMDHARQYMKGVLDWLEMPDVKSLTVERDLGEFRYTLVEVDEA